MMEDMEETKYYKQYGVSIHLGIKGNFVYRCEISRTFVFFCRTEKNHFNGFCRLRINKFWMSKNFSHEINLHEISHNKFPQKWSPVCCYELILKSKFWKHKYIHPYLRLMKLFFLLKLIDIGWIAGFGKLKFMQDDIKPKC